MSTPESDDANVYAPIPVDSANLSPEAREEHWLKNVYQGDRMPQLTVRAVVMGGLIGMLMSISNLYTTLKLGWAFGVAITACVISYTIWNTLVSFGVAKTRMSILENNCMQSTASAAGYSTGGTLATAVGALLMIGGDANRMGWIPVAIWVMLVAFLGVFLAIPMKRQMINVENLTFPSGVAAAETLKSLYSEGKEAMEKSRVLIGGIAFGAIWALRTKVSEALAAIPFPFPVVRVGSRTLTGDQMGMNFDLSAMMISAGMLMGLRASASMLLAAGINYLVIAPYVMGLPDHVLGTKTFLGQIEVILGEGGVVEHAKVRHWSLWGGTAILVTSGLTSFALSWRTIAKALSGVKNVGSASSQSDEIEVPLSWMVMGMVPITLGLVLLCYLAMGIAPWLGLLSVVLSFFLALVACRATGETDTTPVGALGKITQLTYAILAPANKTINLMTAGITAGAAGSSADLLTDLKSGYVLGANPRKQFLAQFYGVFFGTVAVVPAWYLLVPNQAALEKFNPPATSMWYAVAEALAKGIDTIPYTAQVAIVVGGLLGIVTTLTENFVPNAKKYLPSTVGIGLGLVVDFPNSLSFFVGAVIAELWTRANKVSGEKYIIPLASGIVAGESLLSAGEAIWGTINDLILGGGE